MFFASSRKNNKNINEIGYERLIEFSRSKAFYEFCFVIYRTFYLIKKQNIFKFRLKKIRKTDSSMNSLKIIV